MRISTRGAVDPFIAMDVMEAARRREHEGADIVHMEVGQPGAPAPRRALEAAEAALRSGPLGYTVALGLPALREGIARRYRERHGADVAPERIAVTTGSSGGFLLAFLALFDAGARVALADPSYPGVRNILKALGLEIARLEAGPESRYQPSPALLANARRMGSIDGVLAASPANPTGAMLTRDAMVDLVEECQRLGAAFISDEIYHGVEYGARAVSALEISNDVIVVNSFSKYFSMTGWRVGWMVVPEDLAPVIERLAQNLFICPPHVSQVAALAALDADEELEANVAVYAANRELLLEELPKAGFDGLAPCDGAFYLYADVSRLTDDSAAFCARMLAEAGVAATPGLDFDPVRGGTTVRFSFAGPTERMAEGARRLKQWAKR
ncbi:MAG: aminotransferase class I/II-fold pyridoxal phosphate-dependent enzyme [Rhodobacteraceae bacterium]|nr:MAG: aminotransferase class I/II-fold pyridoxal phosphate-dependent enzyme [Paracoccaceae bacterium]